MEREGNDQIRPRLSADNSFKYKQYSQRLIKAEV